MNAYKYIIILLFLFSFSSHASLQQQFLTLLDQDAHGQRLEGSTQCLQELSSLSHRQTKMQISNEIVPSENRVIIGAKSSFKINSYSVVSTDSNIYNVKFSIAGKSDYFQVIRYTSLKKIKLYGEYEIFSPPQNFYIYQRCQQ